MELGLGDRPPVLKYDVSGLSASYQKGKKGETYLYLARKIGLHLTKQCYTCAAVQAVAPHDEARAFYHTVRKPHLDFVFANLLEGIKLVAPMDGNPMRLRLRDKCPMERFALDADPAKSCPVTRAHARRPIVQREGLPGYLREERDMRDTLSRDFFDEPRNKAQHFQAVRLNSARMTNIT